nr:protein iq-domain 1 [Ipomoea batatas]
MSVLHSCVTFFRFDGITTEPLSNNHLNSCGLSATPPSTAFTVLFLAAGYVASSRTLKLPISSSDGIYAQARRALRLERIGEASSYSLRMAARPWETRLLEQATSNSSKPCTAKVRKNNVTKRISTKPPEAVPKFL